MLFNTKKNNLPDLLLLLWSVSLIVSGCDQLEESRKDLPPPNILVLSIEDISPYAFSMYGNTLVDMPAIDRLAQEGITFDHASSCAPYCSPARSTIISGSFATTYGTDIHREARLVPVEQYLFPRLLKETGYFTTNNSKTDYNIADQQWKKVENEVWSENSGQATYNSPNRKEGQPFFAVFNNLITHWSRLNSIDTSWRQPLHIPVDQVRIPAFLPDIPQIRNGLAWHYQKAEQASEWVDVFLQDLEAKNLLENTIIFFYSDHGGVLPRSKGFGYYLGTHIPFIVRIPAAYQHYFDQESGTRSKRLVDFTDLAPTILSLAGIEPPAHMQGEALWGKYQQPQDSLQFTFRTNNASHFAPSRSAFDGRYHYIRFFVPYKPDGLRQDFQFKLPELLAYDSMNLYNLLTPDQKAFFEPKSNYEALFDLENDPDETNNLANDSDHQQTLSRLRSATYDHLIETKDLGFFPPNARYQGGEISLYEWVRASKYPLQQLIDAAWNAGAGKSAFRKLEAFLSDHRPEMRFWTAVAYKNAAQKGWIAKLPDDFTGLLNDSLPETRATAGAVLYALDKQELANEFFEQELKEGNGFAYSALEEMDTIPAALLPVIKEMAQSDQPKRRFYARSLLINTGQLPHHKLLEAADYQEVEENFVQWQNHMHWLPN